MANKEANALHNLQLFTSELRVWNCFGMFVFSVFFESPLLSVSLTTCSILGLEAPFSNILEFEPLISVVFATCW
jgi:hypothetical protein